MPTMPDAAPASARETTARPGMSGRLRRLDIILIALLAISLLGHALTLAGVLSARAILRDQIGQLAAGVQQAKETDVRYNILIDQRVPVRIDVPLQHDMRVPIQTDVRIDQAITIPIDTGFGVANIPIPIRATIPVSATVPIRINETLPISTTIPIRMEVPLDIDLGSPSFAGYFDQLYRALIDLRDKL
jgi:hypothetical protein